MTMEEVGYQERPKGDNVLTQTSMISSGRERRAESRTTRQGVSAGANEVVAGRAEYPVTPVDQSGVTERAGDCIGMTTSPVRPVAP